jgi:4-carboxymuconolactone decarboxylase
MARIDPIPPERMTAEQRRMRDTIATQRVGGRIRGPFAVLLHAPEIGERVAEFVNHLMSDTRVPTNLKEIAILTIARKYTAQYEFYVHEKRARQSGIDGAVIDAIRRRQRPDFSKAKEALVYDMTDEILEAQRLSDDHYARAVKALGEPAVVELVSLIGFYIMVAVLLVSYEVEIPDGGTPPLID